MASQSRDELQDDSAQAEGSAKSAESPPSGPEAQVPAAASDDAVALAGFEKDTTPEPERLVVEDEELIEMLEQLNETLDSARIALSEHPNIPGLTASAAVSMAGDTNMPGPEQQRQSLAKPMLAAALGMCLGAGGLTLLWPVWTARQPAGLQAEPGGTPQRETRVSRGMQVVPPDGDAVAAVPLPEPRPVLKTIRERAPLPAPRLEAALAANPGVQFPMADVAAADAAAPATQAEFVDKPDFEEKDASNSMPVPARPELAALPRKTAPLPVLTPEEEAALMTRGNGFLDNGDFASARLVYEHAATRGSAEAMYALARSYDPRFLKEQNPIGIKPDRKLALDWYARAAEKGHDQADAMASELERTAAQ